MADWHPNLAAQLKRLGLSEDRLPGDSAWKELVQRVDQAYKDAEQDRWTLERSLAASSEEMAQLYLELKRNSENALAAERDKLLESEKRYARAVQGTNDGIWDWDMRTGACYFSPRWKAQLGYGPEELEDRVEVLYRLLHRRDYAKVQDALRRHLEEKQPFDIELRLRQKDGHWRWIRSRGQAEWDEEGQAVRMAGSHTDITFQKEAEAAVRESEARFRALVDNVPGAVFRLRNDALFSAQFMSEGIQPICGHGPQDFLDGHLNLLDLADETQMEEVAAQVSTSLVAREPFQVEFRLRHQDGGWRWVAVQGRGVVMEDGRQPYLDGIILDITRLKEQQEELQRSKEAAEAATRAKSEFLANMSHEIRTPMNGVLGMTGFLLDSTLAPEQREYAETVRSCAEGLLEIVNDILDFSKIEAGKLDLEPLAFDLREVVEDALAMAAPRATAKGLELACLLEPGTPRGLLGDAGRVRQILVNLVGNAVKFTEKGQVVVRVRSPDEDTVDVEVEDSGIGIPEAALSRLFSSFTQADGSMARRFGGTGLGLAISRQLVELMGGEIGVRSEVGKGSTFHFSLRLPRAEEVGDPPPPELAGRRALLLARPGIVRACNLAALRELGMEPEAADGPEGVSLETDVLLVDVVSLGEAGLRWAAGHRGVPPLLLLLPTGWKSVEGLPSVLGRPLRLASLQDGLLRTLGHGGGRSTAPLPAPSPRRGRVLVAEDNPVNQKVISKVLERLGLRVDVAANGLEALQAASSLPYDLVFMDCQMPEMDGFEATAALRQRESPGGRHLPIVALTAHAMQGERERCLQSGMDDYTTKPLKLAELERILDRFIAPEEAGEEALDPEVLRQLAHLQPSGAFLADLVALLRRDLPPRMEALALALVEGRCADGALLAHALRGALGTLGARAASERAGEMELLLQDERLDAARNLAPRLESSATRALAALEGWLAGAG